MATNTAITTTDVRKAATELAGMRRSLVRWLKVRAVNDSVLAGTVTKLRKPLSYAQRAVASMRDMSVEQDLATKLFALLSTITPDTPLPSANLATNPQGAVQLAQIAIAGSSPQAVSSPTATGNVGMSHPWLWPVLIVGGLLLAITTAIKTAADVAETKEQTACIEAGACTDYGFWLKAGGIVALSWFAWEKLGVGDSVKSFVGSKRRS